MKARHETIGGAGVQSSYATPPRLSREWCPSYHAVVMDCQVLLFPLLVFSCLCEPPTSVSVVLKAVSVTWVTVPLGSAIMF